jgi:hypothetical protein
VPKELFENEFYSDLSSDSKLLYGMLMDRMKLSEKNNWINENNEIYLIFSRETAQNLLNISGKTATKIFNELKEKELIFEERQGLNKPNIIFIGKINYKKRKKQAEKPENSGKRKNYGSRTEDITDQEPNNLRPNDTELNDTDLNDTETEKGFEKNSNDNFEFETPVIFMFATRYADNDYQIDNVQYYFRKYKEVMGKDHPDLKPSQWKRVFGNIIFAGDYEVIGDFFERIVDQHFKTNYKNCDYNIMHFISGQVMKNRYYEVERDEDQELAG